MASTAEEIFRNAGFHRNAAMVRENGSRFQIDWTYGKRTALGTYGDFSRQMIYSVSEAREEDGKVHTVMTTTSKSEAEAALELVRSGGTYVKPAKKCQRCRGTGKYKRFGDCFACDGKGTV